MEEIFTINVETLLGITALLLIILCILLCLVWIQLAKLRKKYAKMMNGTGVTNLEEIIIHVQKEVTNIKNHQKNDSIFLNQIAADMKKMKSRVGLHRYNAFNEQGNDLSFSLAIIDEHQTGIIISGIHGRDETYLYAKPLEYGQSKYTLSPEEKDAINLALKKE